jgi:hypothetical protein
MAAKIGKDVNWKELKVGEYIKSIQGHGPFYVLEYTDDKEPEVIHMGHYGIFKVAYLEENGIGAYQIHRGHRSGGFCYIYMGKQKIESVTGTIMRPHKIKKVTPRVRE